MLVTDHHLPGDELPLADAIVNPNQPGCEFPSKALAGVGVIFYVLMALRARLRSLGWYELAPQPNIGELLDLVALGSVADVVPLDANNRILVHQGLERIRAGRARPGIKAILEVAKRNHARITSTDLGFIVGPRLNAAGRLDDMSLGIECMITDDAGLAREMAVQLDGMNQDRKSIEQGMQREALAQLKDLPVESMPFGLCRFDPEWQPGCHRHPRFAYERSAISGPTIAFADAGDGLLKGSGRSVQGFPLLPRRVERGGGAAPQPDQQIRRPRHGGWSDSAGSEFSAVRRGLRRRSAPAIARRRPDRAPAVGRHAGGRRVPPRTGSPRALRHAGPWGQHFPEPLFHGVFQLVEQRVVWRASPESGAQKRMPGSV